MITYLCNGSHLVGTQADARALDRDFVQLDIPVDKAGLMAFVNDLYRQINEQGESLSSGGSEARDYRPELPPTPAEPGVLLPIEQSMTDKIDSWFAPVPETGSTSPIDRMIANATYTEALRINQASVERMVTALVERKHTKC